MKAALAIALWFVGLPAVARPADDPAQHGYPVRRPDDGRPKDQDEAGPMPPPAIPMDRAPRTVRVPGRPSPNRSSGALGGLAGIRALSSSKDQIRVGLPSGQFDLRPGDAIQGYVVRSVEPRRLVLLGSEQAGSAQAGGIAVVTFDPEGRGRVVIYRLRDESAPVAPEVR
jgi:hypothetical protein